MGKAFVIMACLCAVAYAQFGNSGFQSQSSFGQSSGAFGRGQTTYQQTAKPGQYQQSSFGSQNQFQQNQPQRNQYQQQSSFGSQNQFQQNQPQRNQYQQSQYQQNQNQYQQNQYQQNQYQQPSAAKQNFGSCKDKERSPVSGSCDRYNECVNGAIEEKLCPDGLRFNPSVRPDVYPCQYPSEVPCLERSSLQPAQPTADCPHQFGLFKLGDARNCSGFRNCVNGVGFDLTCPEGLAFSSESYRCEWPDEVADCDAEAFLGFRCPEVPVSRELGPPVGYRYYRSDTNCQKYFICIENRPRALSCGGDSAFDELTSTCVSADEVSSCPSELRALAARSREEEKQRLAKEVSLNAKPLQQKRRY
ncbi:protein obstructor-E-like [Achroia grisella]|uniref:protein obstructor-E-like n=1 Tax=Achroia grisella TaxID=688607 RepID=UPI0027D34D50|nr:protein obstructor-E-like [Achroia grisella]